MKGYTAQQIRDAEAPLLAAGEPLMQHAAEGLARVILNEVGESATVLVLAGPGDNGGDALFAAALLAETGHHVTVVRTADRVHERALAAAVDAGVHETTDALGAAEDADVIVDGMLGTGSTPGLRGRSRDVAALLLPLLDEDDAPLVVAVDIPSGIGASDGSMPDDTVLPADLTVTFGGVKAGLLLEPATSVAGEIVLVDIGLDLADVEAAVEV